MTLRRIIYVSGAPGSGKSTLARPLAEILGLPLLSKDIIKERLADSLPDPIGDRMAWSRALGGAAMETIWTLAALFPAAVLEANFRPRSDYERAKLLGLGGRLVEVHCACAPDEAARRYAARGLRADQHPIHVARTIGPELLAEFDRPVGLGALVRVDTGGPVEAAAVAQEVRRLLD